MFNLTLTQKTISLDETLITAPSTPIRHPLHHWQTINPISLDNTSHQGALAENYQTVQQQPRLSPFAKFTFVQHPPIQRATANLPPYFRRRCLSLLCISRRNLLASMFDPFTNALASYQGHLGVSYDLFGQVSRATRYRKRENRKMELCDVRQRLEIKRMRESASYTLQISFFLSILFYFGTVNPENIRRFEYFKFYC